LVVKKVFAVIAICLISTIAISDTNEPNPEFVVGRLEVTNRNSYMVWPDYFPWNPPWHHDYPDADEFLTLLLRELTNVRTGQNAVKTVRLDSPEVFKYPFVYLSEPGFLMLNDNEIKSLGEYIRRGGFIMADDFRTAEYLHGPEELDVLRYYLKRALPERELVRLDVTHPVFHTFYDLDSLQMESPYPIGSNGQYKPEFWGMSDEHGNLQLIANYNNDVGDYWKYLDHGEKPLRDSARSVRLGVNYVIYAMTH
jgi:hypothetical protein